MPRPSATVVVPSYNEAQHLRECVRSILKQTVRDWELIVVDDHSSDDTEAVLRSFADSRICYMRNRENLGPAASRNRGVEAARSEFVFFIDADCAAAANWIEEGLQLFNERRPAGIEGKLVYVHPDYRPAFSDRVVENPAGGKYMTANMAYSREALVRAGLFNPALRWYEDRELALRIKQSSDILFNPQMVVTHAHVKWTPASYFRSARTAAYFTVKMYKTYRSDQAAHRIYHHVYQPKNLLAIFFPPLVLAKLLTEKIRSGSDFLLFALIYPRLVFERLLLWKASIRERTLLI